jgi:sec-independent protein translocase protein TatA
MGLNPFELGVCLVIVVLLFGVKRLPELGTGLGKGISNFRKSFREGNAIDVSPANSEESSTKNESSNKE